MIVTFGTYDAGRHPRVGVLVEGLRAHGFTVQELDRPLGLSTAQRVRMLNEPWRLPGLAVRLLRCWALLVGDAVRFRRHRGRPGAVLVGYLGHFDVLLARLVFPRTPIVLDHLVFAGDTATDRGARGLRVRLLRGLDRAALACADVVVVDTAEHAAMLRDVAPTRADRAVVVPVGAPRWWFDVAASTTSLSLPGVDNNSGAATGPDDDVQVVLGEGDGAEQDGAALRIVFFGLFTPLQGARVIADALADALPRARAAGRPLAVTMVGSGQDLPAVRARLGGLPDDTGNDVTWLDWVEPTDLPALVAAHDVCLGIFSTTPKGLRVVPNKVFQGLAAGCVVITSDTAPQRRLLSEHLELVPPGDAAALADLLVELADPAVPAVLADARRRAAGGRDRVRADVVVEPLVGALRALGVTS